MFIGSMNSEMRNVINELCDRWGNREVYVGCSGNFVIERILFERGITKIHSNDVSLYSCLLGDYLAGKDLKVEIKDDTFLWLGKYMKGGVDSIAAILLFGQLSNFLNREEPFFVRMRNEYMAEFDKLHKSSVEKISKSIGELKITDMYHGDVCDFIKNAPKDAVVISYPPTYKAGYEKIYKKIDATFEWERPSYKMFDDESFDAMLEEMQRKKTWVIAKDASQEKLGDNLIAKVQTTMRSKPVYMYSNEKLSKLIMPNIKSEILKIPRLKSEITGDIKIIKLKKMQFDGLRAQYLGKNIVPAQTDFAYGLIDNGRLLGVLAFGKPKIDILPNMVYMMSDFCVSESVYRRLSKLVAGIALTEELGCLLEQNFRRRVDYIVTTAFTEKGASMKYRGLYDVQSRKEGKITYCAKSKKWTMKECFEWWMNKHGHELKE